MLGLTKMISKPIITYAKHFFVLFGSLINKRFSNGLSALSYCQALRIWRSEFDTSCLLWQNAGPRVTKNVAPGELVT
jgi:hypothetical protein